MSTLDTLPVNMVEFLLSGDAQQALDSLTPKDLDPDRTLPTLTSLRSDFTPEEAGSLVTLARLRLRATAKFPEANRMYFTADALEQATAWPVALHRAEWIDRYAPAGPVLDLGCGIGGDTLAMAKYRRVIAFERDPVRIRFAQANASVAGVADRIEFRSSDWTSELSTSSLPVAAAAYVDPSRRIAGRRVFSLHEMQPPLKDLLRLLEHTPNLAAKVMPGVSDKELPADCAVEFISHKGVCKEAILWFGVFALRNRWASVHTPVGWHSLFADEERPPVGDIVPGSVLYEPDPAVIRAGAFSELSDRLDAHLIDPHIAYLISDTLSDTPFASAFLVREVLPFNLRHLNARLQALDISSVELKKRGAPFEPESLRPRLKLSAHGTAGVVFFTRVDDAPIMIIARRP